MNQESPGMTSRLANFIVNTQKTDIPEIIFEHAKVAFMDWLAVTMGGKDDPLVHKLIQYTDLLGGKEQATIIGHGIKKTMAQAALINGSASHALDYDDSLASFLGHPTVTLFPGLMALGEVYHKSGDDILSAYIIGLKAGTVIASCAGFDHYMSGFHGTATIGCLASAAACSRLLNLDVQQTIYALGIAATQSGGLKQNFGSMCKPFHAGRASEAGLMSANLAGNGFTAAADILEGANGFFKAMQGAVNENILNTLGQTWAIEELAQKYHASCHVTHSPIEAAWSIFDEQGLSVADVKSIKVYSSEMGLSAAYRTEAHNGLEGKFCIAYCVSNALIRGREHTGLQAFSDERVNDPEVQAFMNKISTVQENDFLALEAKVEIETNGGETYSAFSNILNEIPKLDVKQIKIKDKFSDLCLPVVGVKNSQQLIDLITNLNSVTDIHQLVDLF
jgi:2-methylcitrate dehydratase PrpD